jgi:hypothetical protein
MPSHTLPDRHRLISFDDLPKRGPQNTLALNGIVSHFNSRRPTKEEFDRCPHVELTASEPEWNPHDAAFSRGETAMMGDDGNILRRMMPNIQTREIMGARSAKNMAKADDTFLEQLEQSVKISSVQSTARTNKTRPEQLSLR